MNVTDEKATELLRRRTYKRSAIILGLVASMAIAVAVAWALAGTAEALSRDFATAAACRGVVA